MDFALTSEFSPSEYRYQPAYRHTGTNLPNMVTIMQQLHLHLSPEKVFSCYGAIIGQYLPINGIKLHFKEYQLSWGSEQGLHIKQHLPIEESCAVIEYRLNAPMLNSQTELLYQLQALLVRPLYNAAQYEQMAKQAMYDALTQLGNRRYYMESLKQSLARATRHSEPLSLIVLDLDHFKTLNDRYGHHIGDETLITFGQTINQAIRGSDQAFRIGGDEFTILVQGNAQAASLICQRILTMMQHNNQLHNRQIYTSLGVAEWQSLDSAESLYLRADKALYDAKVAGRRCYRIAA